MFWMIVENLSNKFLKEMLHNSMFFVTMTAFLYGMFDDDKEELLVRAQ